MGNNHFSSMPNISIPRSRFNQPFNHSTSFKHGDLIPIDCFEIVPGDGFKCNLTAIIRMSTPIAPIMGNIKGKIVAFFVPWRLVWENTEEFYGANKTSAGPQLLNYKIPKVSVFTTGVPSSSVSHYLGKPYCVANANKTNFGYVSNLKERAYWLIWSEWYRAQQLQDPCILSVGGGSSIGSISGVGLTLASNPAKVCKEFDYFTAATISPQYGAAVSLPLGTYAPIVTGADHSTNGGIMFGHSTLTDGTHPLYLDVGSGASNLGADPTPGSATTTFLDRTNLVADLSNATAATINTIRYAFQLQKYLERSNFGSRFFEVLAAHYGVTSPDARLQRPEYLGGHEFPIVVSQVLSTAGYDASVNTEVGQPGAVSVTGLKNVPLFTKDFVEPGYVMIMLSTTHERVYSQGLLREDFLFERFEHYSPEFANLGDQAILNKEIMLTGDATDDQTFGFNEHWAELRYRKNRVSGLLDPAVPGALGFWTLADKYSTRPALSASFIQENRDDISRCLVTGANGPDYIGDFFFSYVATRELPLYTIPGLIDHFGVR